MGTYKYSHKIGRGGMAQVYLAIQEGIGGFEKPVVVKRIFPHLCESKRFVKMFLDEARLAATVRHPNVVEILDIGHDDEGYFIVMEYLSGETVAVVAQTLSRQKRTVPPHIACRIGASVAAGLHHAHEAKDASGNRQPLVHRDVTPSNLILCYNGAVKIVDFGIAKAIESAEEGSDASAIKGKLSYLAPEQIRNRGLDARTDVFQLGIVMHEMLCGRRLFNARSNHQKILAVLNREIPRPSSYNPLVPDHVDDIVLHALERDRNQRIQSADELRERLEGALERMGQPVSDAQLGSWLRKTFPTAHNERQEVERTAIKAARSAPKLIDTHKASNRDITGPDVATGPVPTPASRASQSPGSAKRRSSHRLVPERGSVANQAFGAATATSTPSAMARADEGSSPGRPGGRSSTSIPSLAGARSIHGASGQANALPLAMRETEAPAPGTGDHKAPFETEGPTPSANGERVVRERRRPDSLISVLLANAKKDAGSPGHDPGFDQPAMDMPMAAHHAPMAASQYQERRRAFWPLALVAVVIIGLASALVLGPDDDAGTTQAGFSSRPTVVAAAADPATLLGSDNQNVPGETNAGDPDDKGRETPAKSNNTGNGTANSNTDGTTYDVSLVVVPKTAKLVFDGGSEHSTGSFYRTLPRDGETHMLVVSAPGHSTEVLEFSNERLPPAVVRLQKLADGKGDINVQSNGRNSDVKTSRRDDRRRNKRRNKRRSERNKSSSDNPAGKQGNDDKKTEGKTKPKDPKPDKWPVKPKSDNIDPWAD